MTDYKNNNLEVNEIKELQHPEAILAYLQDLDIPIEILDVAYVAEMGAKKHGRGTWADPDNASLQHKSNHASLSRHLAEHYCKVEQDHESGLNPLLHIICRSVQKYTRIKRKIDVDY